MGSRIGHSIKGNILIYISMFFLLYPDINFGKDNFFSQKPLAIWFCSIFVLLNIDALCSAFFKVKKSELAFFSLYLFTLFLGFMMKDGENGIQRNINGYIGFFAIYFAVRIYTLEASLYRTKMLFKAMYISYIYIILFFGSLQAIYIYFGHSDMIGRFLQLVLYRGSSYFVNLGNGRLSFSFSEPSLAGSYFYCFFLPVHWVCKKYEIFDKKKLKYLFIIMFAFNCLTLSARFMVDSLVVMFIFFACKWKKGKVNKRELTRIIVIICSFMVAVVVFLQTPTANTLLSRFSSRINDILNSFDFTKGGDQSTIVRFELAYISIAGFLHNPIMGVGVGNFVTAAKEFMVLPTNLLARDELLAQVRNPGMTSYSFYLTTLCECGTVGIMMIFSVISMLRQKKNREMRILSWIIIYMLFQLELFGALHIALWLAMINSDCKLIDDMRENAI